MTDLNVQLLPWQQEVYSDPTRFKVVAAGRRTGKSRLAAWMLIINALQADKGHVFYVAPTQGQARDIMWQTLLELGHPVIAGSHINNLQLKLVNGATISLKGADRPETMRGVSLKFLVMDEYADMKPDVWEQILRPALADQKGSAMFIGTPMGRNHFYELYKLAELGDDETYKGWHFTSYDNPILDPNEINTAKKSMSSYAFRQEFMASFEARGSEMFKEDWVYYGEEPEVGDYYIAVDLAGFEEVNKKRTKNTKLDETAIAVVKVSPDGWYVDNIIHGRWSLDETATKIFQAVRDYRPITHGNKKKTDRVMWALQGRFENGFVSINKGEWNNRFLDQLFQFPDPLTHDDLVDALAYIDQLAKVAYSYDYEIDEHEILDIVAGY
jgi:phage terminase large subunit-like protein